LRGGKLLQLDKSTSLTSPLKRTNNSNLTLSSASLISQFIMTRTAKAYIRRFGSVCDAQYPVYGENNEEAVHFLLSCPRYAHERWTLARIRQSDISNTKEQKQMRTVSGHLGSESFRLEVRFPDLRDSLDKTCQDWAHTCGCSALHG
jgi:hypothetical protein